MDAVTHPHDDVAQELAQHFVAVKLESGKHPELTRRLGVRWLPGMAVVDTDERAANIQIGFLPVADLLAETAYGRAIVAMGAKRYDEAHALFAQVVDTDGAERAPEAAFWWGVSRYRQTKNFDMARAEWARIVERWPRSQWARKVGYTLEQTVAT